MNTSWNTTVTEVLGIFRQALAALVPMAEKARMPWRDGEAYDDWDSIAGCLYTNIVARAISCAREGGSDIELPSYDMVYPSYKDAFIQVEGGGVPEGVTAVFIGFAGVSRDFVAVKWVRMLPSGEVPEPNIEYSPYEACEFYLVHGKGTERKRIHTLTVEI